MYFNKAGCTLSNSTQRTPLRARGRALPEAKGLMTRWREFCDSSRYLSSLGSLDSPIEPVWQGQGSCALSKCTYTHAYVCAHIIYVYISHWHTCDYVHTSMHNIAVTDTCTLIHVHTCMYLHTHTHVLTHTHHTLLMHMIFPFSWDVEFQF